MTKFVGLWTALFFCVGSSIANGHECTKDYKSESDPIPIIGNTADQYGKFRWMTDADVINGQTWSCNCIFNEDDKGWVGQWTKAGITIPVISPIGPGGATCKEIHLGEKGSTTDLNAPIIYATSNQIQPASIFVSASGDRASNSSTVRVRSSQIDDNGKPVEVDFQIQFERIAGSIEVTVSFGQGLILAIGNLASIYGGPQLATALDELKGDPGLIGLTNLIDWVEPAIVPQLMTVADLDQQYLLLSNKISTRFPVSESATTTKTDAKVIVFDQRRHPLISITFDALAAR